MVFLVAGIDDYARLVAERCRGGVTSHFVTAPKRYVVHVDECRAKDLVLPVDRPNVPVIVQRTAFIGQEGRIVRLVAFDHVVDIIVGGHHVDLFRYRLYAEGSRVGDDGASDLSFFCFDDDDAVGAARTVDRCCRGVFENGHRLDVFGVERCVRKVLDGESVDDVKGRIVLREGVRAADHDVEIRARLSVGRGDVDACYTALQSLVERCDGGFDQVGDLDDADRSADVLFPLLAVANFDHHGVDFFGVFGHCDVDFRAGPDKRFLLGIAQQTEFKHVA